MFNTTTDNEDQVSYNEVHVDDAGVSEAAARVIRLIHISDTHKDAEQLRVPPGDVLIHSGDFFHWRTSVDFDADIASLNEFFDKQPHTHKVG